MRSLLLQLLSVLCFYGILFSTGKRPNAFASNFRPVKKQVALLKPKKLETSPTILASKIAAPSATSFSVFPKVPAAALRANPQVLPKVDKTNGNGAAKEKANINLEEKSSLFQIATETSLREFPGHESEVLKRIREGEQVEIIESTEKYWWKVNYAGRVGWVKRHLLVRA